MAERTLNPMTEQPTKLTQITKAFILAFAESEKANKGDVDFIIGLFENNKKAKNNSLTGEMVQGYDMNVIRKAFAQKYFPNLLKTKSNILDDLKRIKK